MKQTNDDVARLKKILKFVKEYELLCRKHKMFFADSDEFVAPWVHTPSETNFDYIFDRSLQQIKKQEGLEKMHLPFLMCNKCQKVTPEKGAKYCGYCGEKLR